MFDNGCDSSMIARLYIIIVKDSLLEDIRFVKSFATAQYRGNQDLSVSILLILIFWDMQKTLPIKLLQQLETIWWIE